MVSSDSGKLIGLWLTALVLIGWLLIEDAPIPMTWLFTAVAGTLIIRTAHHMGASSVYERVLRDCRRDAGD